MPEEQAYLIFGLLAQSGNIGWEKRIPGINAKVRIILITEYKRIPANIFESRVEVTYCLILGEANHKLAENIVQAIISLFCVFSEDIVADFSIFAYPITKKIIKNNIIKLDDLLACNRSLEYDQKLDDTDLRIASKSGRIIGPDYMDLPCNHAGAILNKGLLEASSYLSESMNEYYIYPVYVPEILADPLFAPDDISEQKKAESSFLKAYKVVESIIGDPGSDLRKIKSKCKEKNIDPDELVGFKGDKEALANKIKKCGQIRDKKAGHGMPQKKSRHMLSYYELYEMQNLAQVLILRALEI